MAPQAVERCAERVSQLYEQGGDMIHIGAYVRRWLRCTEGSFDAYMWQALETKARLAEIFALAVGGFSVIDSREISRQAAKEERKQTEGVKQPTSTN